MDNEVLDFEELFDNDDLFDRALGDAIHQTLLDHKRTGDPIVAWQDGGVVWIPADQIDVDAPLRGG